jgi:hypothetical protein
MLGDTRVIRLLLRTTLPLIPIITIVRIYVYIMYACITGSHQKENRLWESMQMFVNRKPYYSEPW